MSTPVVVWVDGRIVPPGEAAVRPDDHGLLLGDGVFETMLVRDGRPVCWDRHLARLHQALTTVGIAPVGAPLLQRAVDEVLSASELMSARLRVTVTSGPGGAGLQRGPAPTVVVSAAALPATDAEPPPLRAVTARGARNERSPLAGIKTTSYAEAAALSARAAAVGADDVLLGDSKDRLSEALTANVFVVLDGRVLTPALSAGCLPGIVRDLLLQWGVAVEADIALASLAEVDEAFLTSSVAGVRPLGWIDNRALPRVVGSVTTDARRALAEAEAQSR